MESSSYQRHTKRLFLIYSNAAPYAHPLQDRDGDALRNYYLLCESYYLLCKIIGVSSVVIEQVLQVIPTLFLSICILARVPTLF